MGQTTKWMAATTALALWAAGAVGAGLIETADADPRDGFLVEGRLVDGDGKPVPGVRVSAMQNPPQVGLPFVNGVSNEKGVFRLEGVSAPTPGRQVVVELLSQTWRAIEAPVLKLAPGKDFEAVQIRITKGRTVRGRVVDAEGKPIKGAAVTATWAEFEAEYVAREGSDLFADREPLDFKTKTDVTGAFELPGVPESANVRFTAFAQGHSPAVSYTVDCSGDLQAVELRCERAATFTGHILDADGKPVPNAVLECRPKWVAAAQGGVSGKPGRRHFELTWLLGIPGNGYFPANAKGEAKITGLSAGSYEVKGLAEGWAVVEAEEIQPSYGRERSAYLRVAPAVTIQGKVVTADGSDPGECYVAWQSRAGSPILHSATSNARGLFAIEGAPNLAGQLTAAIQINGRWKWGKPVPCPPGGGDVKVPAP